MTTHFRHLLLLLGLCLLIQVSTAQEEEKEWNSDFPTEGNMYNGLFIRGKAIAGFFLEDWWLANLSGGLEYRFKYHEAIGVDYVFYEQWFERDLWDTITGAELSTGFSQMDLRQFITIDYRHYSDMKKVGDDGFVSFYTCLFFRNGNRRMWLEEGWHYQDNDINFLKQYTKDFGLSFGLHSAFGKSGFGLDTQLGAYARLAKTHQEIYHSNSPMEYVDGTDPVKIRPIFRLNLYYLIGS